MVLVPSRLLTSWIRTSCLIVRVLFGTDSIGVLVTAVLALRNPGRRLVISRLITLLPGVSTWAAHLASTFGRALNL